MIVTQFDKKYLEWGKILTKTSGEKLPSHKLFLATVNLDGEGIEQLKSLHHNIVISNEIVDKKSVPEVRNRKRWGGTIGNHMPEFMASRFPRVLKTVFEKFAEEKIFIMTGADCFVNKSFPFETEILNYDALFLMGNDPQPGVVGEGLHTQFRTGIIVLKNNLVCKAFVDSWVNCANLHKEIGGIKQWHWFWDQVTLKLTLEEMINRKLIKIKGLPHEKFINCSFDESAYMWSSHIGGERGKENTFKTWTKKLEKK